MKLWHDIFKVILTIFVMILFHDEIYKAHVVITLFYYSLFGRGPGLLFLNMFVYFISKVNIFYLKFWMVKFCRLN